MCQLTALEELWLHDNELEALPSMMGKLKMLRTLTLSVCVSLLGFLQLLGCSAALCFVARSHHAVLNTFSKADWASKRVCEIIGGSIISSAPCQRATAESAGVSR